MSEVSQLFYHATFAPNSQIKKAYITLDAICDSKTSNFIDKRFLITPTTSYSKVILNKYTLYTTTNTLALSLLHTPEYAYINQFGRQTIFDEGKYIAKGLGHSLKDREQMSIGNYNPTKKTSKPSYISYQQKCKTQSLEQIIAIAVEKKISLFFFYNPINVRYWEISHIKGSLNDTLFSKKLAKQTLYKYKDTALDIKVFDFRQLNSYTLERLSYKDKHKNHTYWYESSHYKKSLGDILMEAMTNKNPRDNTLFNELLTSDIEENHKHQLRLLNNWREDNLDIVAEIHKTIAEKTK